MIKLNRICLDRHIVLSSLMCHKKEKKGRRKKKTLPNLSPGGSRARLSRGICDPGQTYQHTEHGSARFSSTAAVRGPETHRGYNSEIPPHPRWCVSVKMICHHLSGMQADTKVLMAVIYSQRSLTCVRTLCL